MTFCIITHVSHGMDNGEYYAYSPYVREMNIWSKYVDKIILVAPLDLNNQKAIDSKYSHQDIDFISVPSFNFLSIKSSLKTFFMLPIISFEIFKAMKKSDHIHLRCPGNMGLLGCIIQILFPSKQKTAKYAGNWDYNSRQPLSYRLQRWILKNTFLTKNIQVLVYGNWNDNSKNIKPFFTASYSDNDKIELVQKKLTGKLSFLFVGSLSRGKQPLYAIQLIEKLIENGLDVKLSLYGDGAEKIKLEKYIFEKKIENRVFIKGNQNQETIKKAYLENHFVILPSQSEGWPKVVAEAMFLGCLPIATKVSCLPNMLDNGERGILLEMKKEEDVERIKSLIENDGLYQQKIKKGVEWSRQFTIELFEDEIKKLVKS
ncbi:glycosyltransferase [Flavobacterium capsici]|uniref:Glycosyltransferase n=1 Tax=Flavobacterium capsici TaxID=3075618 RepID=A0AA96J4C6_9FLAO|nr:MULTISPECIES: glycosyltransferase [unclassified Flavobacterium]WNM20267.1 glycosyltransferase [Flavobacterium sp. PMR2A8]WNM21657.1 glycosyltransferase [Flavobacterium sp. PMTSA4]